MVGVKWYQPPYATTLKAMPCTYTPSLVDSHWFVGLNRKMNLQKLVYG